MASAGQLLGSLRHCCGRCFTGKPPDPGSEVIDLLCELRITPRQVHEMYRLFQRLKQQDSLTLATGPNEASATSMLGLIKNKRQWVSRVMRYVLHLAGYRATISWDAFLFVFLQFCSLSKLELCQVVFFTIALEMKSWTVHYLTATQLEEFFDDYTDCPVKSFNTSGVVFSRLGLAKYALKDFIELAFRFSQIVNPFLHLQQELQRAMPGMRFWTDFGDLRTKNRKIGLDFLRHKKVISILDIIEQARFGSRPRKDREQSTVAASRAALSSFIEVDPEYSGKPGFAPLPSQGPPKVKRENRLPEDHNTPAWMTEHFRENLDPLRGTALGSAEEAARPPDVVPELPEHWEAVPDPERPKRNYFWNRQTDEVSWDPPPQGEASRRSVEEVRQLILETMGGPPVARARAGGSLAEGLTYKAHSRNKREREEAMARTEELDFVRTARQGEPKRDDIVSILERTSPCELLDRPPPRLQFPRE